MTTKDKVHFLKEQLKSYETRRYRIDVEMEMLRRCQTDIEGYMTKSGLEEKEEAIARQVEELDIAITICKEHLKSLSA